MKWILYKHYVAPNAIEAPIETSPNSGNTDPAHHDDITMTASNARSRVCHSNIVINNMKTNEVHLKESLQTQGTIFDLDTHDNLRLSTVDLMLSIPACDTTSN